MNVRRAPRDSSGGRSAYRRRLLSGRYVRPFGIYGCRGAGVARASLTLRTAGRLAIRAAPYTERGRVIPPSTSNVAPLM